MTDLRLFNAIEKQQKQQEIQQSSLMQKAAEQVQQQQELSPEVQGIVDRVQQQNERDAIRRRLDNFYTEAAQYASGGGIHIDPSKKGTFTAAASRHGMGVQEFASHVHAHPENYSPAMRKKAAFARASAKWHHGYGGPLNCFAPGGTMSHQNGMIKSILDKYLSNYRITSGYRGPNNKVGKLGNKSAHARLLDDGSSAALDIVADDMNRLREELANPALQKELAAAGFGILDETDPATMKKTGATGAHFHIGQGIKGGGFHLNGYGYQPGYASANYPARGGALQPIVTGSGTDDSGFTPWWTRNNMTDADIESLYASAAGNAPEPEAMDFSQFNLDWSPNTASYPNLFAKGGFTSSPAIRSQIAAWEGSSMYKPAPDTGKVNRPFSAEERDFWNVIPDDVKPYLTQEMADALFSTSYNIGAGNFKKRVVPKLRSVLVNHQGTVEDITNAMYGTRDREPKMKGLRTRRAAERQMFADAYNRAYGEGVTGSYAGVGYGYGEPIMMSQNNSQQEQFTPWWQQSAMTDEDLEALYSSAAGQVPDATPDFAQFNLGWDPVRGRHSVSTFPRLFRGGGRKSSKRLTVGNAVAGSRATTDQCAKFANDFLRENGYISNGNAWDSTGISTVYSGYDGLSRPSEWDQTAVEEYNNAASDNVFNNFNSDVLDPKKIYTVNMYFKGSPYLQEAYNNGTKGRAGTHTGYLQNQDGTWYVVHNIHGNVHIDPLTNIQGRGRAYGITGIYAPRSDNWFNRGITKIGFADGGFMFPMNLFDDGGLTRQYTDVYADDEPMYEVDSPEATSIFANTIGNLAKQQYRKAQITGRIGTQPADRSLPQITTNILKNDVIGRAVMAHNKEGIAFQNRDMLTSAPDSWYYRVYPKNLYIEAGEYQPGKGGVLGFTRPSAPKFISLNGVVRSPETTTLAHEGRHLYQINGLELTPKQQYIIEHAYDDGFLRLPFYDSFNRKSMMARERETTNLDSRNRLLRLMKKGSLIGKGYKSQNAAIQKATWNQILKAVEKSNKYGEEYIKALRQRYKNDPKKLKEHAEKFRQSMMYVGMNDDPAQLPLSLQNQPEFDSYLG